MQTQHTNLLNFAVLGGIVEELRQHSSQLIRPRRYTVEQNENPLSFRCKKIHTLAAFSKAETYFSIRRDPAVSARTQKTLKRARSLVKLTAIFIHCRQRYLYKFASQIRLAQTPSLINIVFGLS